VLLRLIGKHDRIRTAPYESIFKEGKYTPAMLLKMAYINEGLGKVGATLYSLKLYYLISQDEHTEKKLEELSTKFKLSGYSSADTNHFNEWIKRNMLLIQAVLLILLSSMLVTIFLMQRKGQKPWSVAALIFITVSILIYINNFSASTSVIIASDNTYLMEDPSAGANVSAVIGQGNLLQSLGHEDVWLKVRWLDKIVFVKESSVLKIEL
ncbi:MAG: hypothetical protein QM734_13795, partial [Cyclobacteriaceae bacterium]